MKPLLLREARVFIGAINIISERNCDLLKHNYELDICNPVQLLSLQFLAHFKNKFLLVEVSL